MTDLAGPVARVQTRFIGQSGREFAAVVAFAAGGGILVGTPESSGPGGAACVARLMRDLAMTGSNQDGFAAARRRMLDKNLRGRGIVDARVLEAMAAVRRELFVPAEYVSRAYSDEPLPIGLGQTISQPYIVALMTQSLRVGPDDVVLEIGTGCGYQTAILSRLAKKVCTVERLEPLAQAARALLERIGVGNVEFQTGDGSLGWAGERLFNRVMMTAAAPQIPQAIIDQLVDGGLLVAPVGGGDIQQLVVATRKGRTMIERHVCGCRFVRLIGDQGFSG